ncbi:unnamed protein product [Protopolystoma xenopodis]|uniref:Transient receptor ion channel domain-containing protein n=1 Tax=Protopolystoma xenopodis TaxID=117903 RepID=A0A448X6T6_9PLAT|nr:unnamed protein product [Protopolystoma xenopodis]
MKITWSTHIFRLQGVFLGASFPPDLTPIIMAAHRDNYEILRLLLERGDRILPPHDVRCACLDCGEAQRIDSLRHSKSRINTYRALSSPSLIALSSCDPVITAFELSWQLSRLGRLENEFKSDYQELSRRCQQFATDLLDQTRDARELAIILNHATASLEHGHELDDEVNDLPNDRSMSSLKFLLRQHETWIPFFREPEHGRTHSLVRLRLAIKYKQKSVRRYFFVLTYTSFRLNGLVGGLRKLASSKVEERIF